MNRIKRILSAMMAFVLAGTASAKTEFPFLDAMGLDVTPVINTKAGKWDFYPSQSVYVDAHQFKRLTVMRDGTTMKPFGQSGHICMARRLQGGISLIAYRMGVEEGYELLFATYDHDGNLVDAFNAGNWEYLNPDQGLMDRSYGSFAEDGHLLIHRSAVKQIVHNNGDGPVERVWYIDRDYEYAISQSGIIMRVGCTTDGANLDAAGKVPLLSMDAADVVSLPMSEKKRFERFEKVYKAADLADPAVRDALLMAVVNLYYGHVPAMLDYIYAHPSSPVVGLFEEAFSRSIVDKYHLYKSIEDLTEGEKKARLHQVTGQWGPAGAVG
ncbi:MAG: hypothetical protein Q4B68_08310 [Bacteroidales bacterium]|nr:hypothetical protein [Bacteroidales bacterium]